MNRICLVPLMVFLVAAYGCASQHKSWMLQPFIKVDSVNPCLTSSDVTFFDPIRKHAVAWEEKDVFNPSAVVRNGKIYLLYRAEDKLGKYAGTSRIGLAESADGLHFVKRPEPVLYPDNDAYKDYEWEGGCEDPRLVEDNNGTYYMTYTSYDGKTARLFIASSKDLLSWQKHGPVFQGEFINLWSKSGAIVTKRNGNKLVAEKINDKYWMYWGDTDIFLATSDDLIHWVPVKDDTGGLKSIIRPRPGFFDSDLIEPGPPAVLTDKGILLIYNSRNKVALKKDNLPVHTYTAGQALFSSSSPDQLIDRSKKNFFKPDKPYEITGQVNNVVFLEGLVPFNNKWFLYYGTADSKIAVAVYDPSKQ